MQTHRFHDVAGLSLAGEGETRYLTAEAAEELGHALLAIARSIRCETFVDSLDLTTRFTTHASHHEAKKAQGPIIRGSAVVLPVPEALWFDLVQGCEGWRIRQWRTGAFPTGLRYQRKDPEPCFVCQQLQCDGHPLPHNPYGSDADAK